MTERDRASTECSALELAEAIRARHTSARDVVEAHIAVFERRPWLNAIAADRYEAARDEADAADLRIAAADPGESLPPLLGVPCTVKEMIKVQGMPNCAGWASRRGYRAKASAPAAQRLHDAGAIVLGVTNTPGPWIWCESNNAVYGRTSNAYDPQRTAGGSSGGEGAAVGSGGSPIGLGSDFAGSIRIPAFFNGVFGHKPSPGLVPFRGHFPAPTGEAAQMAVIGPLTRRAEDLMPFLRVLAGPDPGDPFSRPVELGDPQAVDLAGLPVLVSEDASVVPTRPELRAARDRAAQALAQAGAEVRTVPLRSLRRALRYYLATLIEDVDVAALLGAALPRPRITTPLGLALAAPSALLLAAQSTPVRTLSRRPVRRFVAAGQALADEVEATIGDGVLLHPPFPRVAPRHRTTTAQPWLLTNTAVFNLLGLPVTQVPLGLDRRGLPLGVQVAAGRDRDHVAIRVALELERALGGWVPPRN